MPSSPASRRAANRCWILVFKIGLFTKCSIGQRQSIAPGARGKVFGLFPFTGVLHQKTKGAPPAKIAADVVLVGDGACACRVKPHRREVKNSGKWEEAKDLTACTR